MINKEKATLGQVANESLRLNYYTKHGIDYLLGQLHRAKQTGHNRWIACCPSHDDRNPSLAIKNDDGKILLRCFAGCSAYEVVSAVGMELADLFPPESIEYRKPVRNAFPAVDVLRCIQREALIITIVASRIIHGAQIDKAELDRLILACNLIEAAYD